MKSLKTAASSEWQAGKTREDVRELAEALSLYRSAMHHVAERRTLRPLAADVLPRRAFRLSLLLAPALAAAIATGILVPAYVHHHHRAEPVARRTTPAAQPAPAQTLASVDDTALMNQIDSEVSEGVPDALRPLADLTEGSTTDVSVTEKKNVTHE